MRPLTWSYLLPNHIFLVVWPHLPLFLRWPQAEIYASLAFHSDVLPARAWRKHWDCFQWKRCLEIKQKREAHTVQNWALPRPVRISKERKIKYKLLLIFLCYPCPWTGNHFGGIIICSMLKDFAHHWTWHYRSSPTEQKSILSQTMARGRRLGQTAREKACSGISSELTPCLQRLSQSEVLSVGFTRFFPSINVSRAGLFVCLFLTL